ncbi:MAG TPA: formate dehydrogenase subunit alpha [Acidobacteriota bacterium]|nr:formate dehydrogenase subunit alpha [Acidobacteriota bacterium]
MTLHLTINERFVEAQEGMTVFEAAKANGILIPTLCHHQDLRPVGSCRLCLVEIAPPAGLATACTLQVRDGLVVQTETPRLVEMRRAILELLLEDYADAGYAAGDREDTEFERWLKRYGVQRRPGQPSRLRFPINADPNPVLWVDMNKCILCTRCVRSCAEIQGRFVWGVDERGHRARISAGTDTGLLEARCESCGTCVVYCPTHALDDRLSVGSGKPEKVVETVCSYCGVGCHLELNIRQEKIIRVTTRREAPVNGRQLCVKGRYGYDFVHHPDRLRRPQVRRYILEGRPRPAGGRDEFVPVDWETALNLITESLCRIKAESGPDAVAMLASAKCSNEDNYLIQKLTRQVIGTNNIDHCARLCHSSTVDGLALCYGSGAMSNTMDDVAREAQALFIIGSNTTEQHPVFGTKLRQAVLKRGVPLVVADPRQIDITEFATLHLKQRPGTDVALINGIMQIVLANGWQDQSFIDRRCEGFEQFRVSVEQYTPERVADITGVPAEQLRRAAEILSRNHPMAVMWSMGITQHTTGVLNVLALGNLQMLLGNMGVRGGGVNPLRGQNNVQGACDVGALPNLFPGYQQVVDAAARSKFAAAWQLESEDWKPRDATSFQLGSTPGLTVTEMIAQAGAGKIRCLYIVGENPAMTDPDVTHAQHCISACEFVVLQEIFPSETAVMADVLLPGTTWAEKEGTYTNTERRIQLGRQAIAPLRDARPDWIIIMDLAHRMMQREGRVPIGPQAAWDYTSPSQIMEEIAALAPNYSGVHYERLEHGEQLHWPVPTPGHPGTPILHIGKFTRGKGKFHVVEHLPPHEVTDSEYPMVLTTGRVLYHWHGAEMTRRTHALKDLYPETVIEISPEDAARIGLNGRTTVRIRSRRGEMVARALITDRVCPGLIFGNFHFPGQQNVNNLTIAALDPISKIPEYKVCAVRIEPV